ncbi:hypothetical protein PST55_25310, partial [Enterobacter cloacae subsp. cloacae]|nr:hypothetical protein [Enterobacter cloacae subsp. cloacae]
MKDQITYLPDNADRSVAKQKFPKDKAVTIITDAGFRTDWFRHVSQLGWSFTGRVRGCISFRLDGDKKWMKISELEATGQPVCVGYGVLSRKP